MATAIAPSSAATEYTTGGGIFCVNFNQDFTSVGVGTKRGYQLYSITSDDKVEKICENTDDTEICTLERLFSSSLVAIVSISYPRRLKVCHFKKKSEICNYSYPNTILSVRLNRARLAVCLEESLYIHNICDMKIVHTITETPPNPKGLCALSTSNENCLLAYPGSNTVGLVQIFDANILQSKTMISAHESPLAAISFNESGTKLATASEKGTVIRVFNVAEGCKIYEFRRGMKRCANIYSLNFSSNSLYLIASSNTETVHAFKLEDNNKVPKPVTDDQSLYGWMSSVVSVSATYLPTPVTDILSQGRAFATVTLPFQGMRNHVAITNVQKKLRIAVASADGFLYIYSFNEEEGGECTLIKQHKLFGDPDSELPVPLSTGYPGSARQMESTVEELPSIEDNIIIPTEVDEPVDEADCSGGSSYARAVKGVANVELTEAERMSEIAAACEIPPIDALALDDESEYPPM